MGNLPIVKDLVVDMEPFWAKFRSVNPYLQPGYNVPPAGREHLITQRRMDVVMIGQRDQRRTLQQAIDAPSAMPARS